MAVTIDNTGKSTSGISVTALNITTFAVGAGANRLLFLGVSQFKTVDTQPTATFNTTEALTAQDNVTIADFGATRRVTVLTRTAPSNATATIAMSWGGGTVDEVVAGATSWTDCAGTLSAVNKSSSSTGTSSSVTVASVTGGAVHDANSWSGSDTMTPNQTSRWHQDAGSNTTTGLGQSAAGTGGSITMTWSTGIDAAKVHIGFNIDQFAGAAAGHGPLFSLKRNALVA